MSIELLIFDCDGVLVDSEPVANRILVQQLGSLGIPMSYDEVMRRFVGRTRDGCLALAAEILGRELPGTFAADWDAALFDAFRSELRAVDGVMEVLREIRLPFCVASNSSPDRMRVSLEASGLLPLFHGRMFSAVEVAKPKPAPDLFLHAANGMGFAPARCAVVEDTTTGVRAAVAAGMTVFGYAAGVHSSANALREAGATIFQAMNKLPELLRSPSHPQIAVP